MDIMPIVVAALAAGAILLIVVGLAGGSPVDPVQARLTQLGTMQAKNLEELELQQPFIERTLRPLATRLSTTVARVTSSSFSERTEKLQAAEREADPEARKALLTFVIVGGGPTGVELAGAMAEIARFRRNDSGREG
mgnify:CR=1 FL=1